MAEELAARFGFARLVVRDLQKQAAFYRAVMGYGEGMMIRADIKGRPIEEIIFLGPDGKTELILLAFGDGPPRATDGAMLGFITKDIKAFEARVLAAGGSIFQPIGAMQGADRPAQLAFYADPEGFLLELIEW
jgi:catechol 2,3-dioxygenase-like lactoylglutathione lyase family enzyme